MVLELNERPSRRYAMRRTVLVVACLTLMAAPAWAGGGFHLFGTYGEVNEWTEAGGFGARLSVGGEKLVADLTATWFPETHGKIGCHGDEKYYDHIQIAPVEVGLRYVFSPGKIWRPYIGGGVSFIVADINVGSVDDDAGYYGLLGLLRHGSGTMGFYGEVVYRQAELSYQLAGGVNFDEDVGGLAAAVGVFLAF
jgi:hypothetical protein